jgi:hypothetical protein
LSIIIPSIRILISSATYALSNFITTTPGCAGEENPDEPVFVQGNIKYTSPFFVNSLTEPFVMLEDEAVLFAVIAISRFPCKGR